MDYDERVLRGTLVNAKGIFEIYGPIKKLEKIETDGYELPRMLMESLKLGTEMSVLLGPEWKIIPLIPISDMPHIVGG